MVAETKNSTQRDVTFSTGAVFKYSLLGRRTQRTLHYLGLIKTSFISVTLRPLLTQNLLLSLRTPNTTEPG